MWTGARLSVGYETLAQVPTQSPLSQKISKDLKAAGFKFCGPTIVYAWMEACGLFNNHMLKLSPPPCGHGSCAITARHNRQGTLRCANWRRPAAAQSPRPRDPKIAVTGRPKTFMARARLWRGSRCAGRLPTPMLFKKLRDFRRRVGARGDREQRSGQRRPRSCCTAESSGISLRQGAHQVAQKFRTTTLPSILRQAQLGPVCVHKNRIRRGSRCAVDLQLSHIPRAQGCKVAHVCICSGGEGRIENSSKQSIAYHTPKGFTS